MVTVSRPECKAPNVSLGTVSRLESAPGTLCTAPGCRNAAADRGTHCAGHRAERRLDRMPFIPENPRERRR